MIHVYSFINTTGSTREVLSWSWLYGSWIYNYLYNQCLSPLTLRVRIMLMARCTLYNIMR